MYLTKKQLDILEFIQNWREESGVSPTLEEMAEHFNVTKITIYEHLNQLEKKGAIRRAKFRARSIEIITPPPRRKATDSLPLLGCIQASFPSAPAQQPRTESQGSLKLNDLFPLESNCYALQVQGDSMKDEIQNGDYVIVEGRDYANDGETVVAILEDGQATLKKYYREGEGVRLVPANQDIEPQYFNKVEVRGVVIGLVRKF